MPAVLKNLLIATLAVFLPIKAILLVSLALCVVDMITGIAAAVHRGEAITSNGLSRTVVKILVYEVAIMAGYLVEQYLTGDLIPIVKILSALVGITELKSVLENLEEISGQKIFRQIVDLLASKSDKIGK